MSTRELLCYIHQDALFDTPAPFNTNAKTINQRTPCKKVTMRISKKFAASF